MMCYYLNVQFQGQRVNKRSNPFYQTGQNNISYIIIKVATCSAINIVKVTISIERQLIYLLAIEIVMFPTELFSNRKQLLLLDRRARQLNLLETSAFRDFEYLEQSCGYCLIFRNSISSFEGRTCIEFV